MFLFQIETHAIKLIFSLIRFESIDYFAEIPRANKSIVCAFKEFVYGLLNKGSYYGNLTRHKLSRQLNVAYNFDISINWLEISFGL